MSKLLKTGVIAVLLTIGMNIAAVADTMYINSNNGLRLRAKASTDAEVLTVIKNREPVNVKSLLIIGDEEWYSAEYDGKRGYLFGEFLTVEEPSTEESDDVGQLLGTWHITAYTHTGSVCANGSYPSAGYTVACNSLDFGTRIYIEGVGERVVEDRGPGYLGSEWIDLFCDSYSECVAWGSQYRAVYLME